MFKKGLSNNELKRYARHLVLPEVGEPGQKKLKSAKVLIVGAGGLGSPIGLYLTAAGVGSIGIIDFDSVSFSNLQRQVLFSEDKIGKPKAEIARERILEINSGIEVKAYNEKLTYKNALDIISDYDVVADGSDNFSAKYLINDACVMLGKPLVYGSVLRFEGQASVFYPKEGPCYRCLYPEPPDGGNVLSCEEAGVLGVLPGIIGSIQANEVIKLIIGKGETLAGRLLVLNSLEMKFREIKFKKNPDCPVCGKNPVIKKLTEELYDFESCAPAEDDNFKSEITVEELKKKIDNKEKFFLLDVREPIETRISSIGGELIPLKELPRRINELSKDDEIIIYCRTGHRSHNAVQFLREQAGFKKVRNLLGGINLWAEKIDNSLQKY
jgi:molybdopterin/thiamine biosynthesis adenylyltransferase/rhodanese-related sulfurtransferase